MWKYCNCISLNSVHLGSTPSCFIRTEPQGGDFTRAILSHVPPTEAGRPASSECQQHAGVFRRNRNWEKADRQTTKRSRTSFVSWNRVFGISVCRWSLSTRAGRSLFCVTSNLYMGVQRSNSLPNRVREPRASAINLSVGINMKLYICIFIQVPPKLFLHAKCCQRPDQIMSGFTSGSRWCFWCPCVCHRYLLLNWIEGCAVILATWNPSFLFCLTHRTSAQGWQLLVSL